MRVAVLPASVSMHRVCDVSERPQESVGSSGIGVTDGCQLLSVLGIKTGSSGRAVRALNMEPSLQFPIVVLLNSNPFPVNEGRPFVS